MPNKKSKKSTRKSKPKKLSAKKKSVSAKRASKARSAPTPARKKAAKKKAPARTARRRRPSTVNLESEIRQEVRGRNLNRRTLDEDSGDLQDLSRKPEADSESVDELADEGNAFEASAVSGVEEADNQDEREVHTHEVPEDDVPEEYLDND